MKLFSPEQVQKIDAEGEARKAERQILLTELVKKLGFREVSSVEELNLTEQEKSKLNYVRDSVKYARFFVADRADGSSSRAVVLALTALHNDDFAAEIFSPAFYDGHAANHDFNKGELEYNLKFSIEGDVYPSGK